MNPFLRRPAAHQRTPLRAQQPEPKAGEAGSVTLRLYDPIDDWGGNWGVSAKEFTAALDQLPDDTTEIRLLINCPGGMYWEGLAILNSLRAHPARVVAVVEGIAASAASFVAAGADELLMMPNSELFVHRAWALVIGNADDLAKAAADFQHSDRNIASIYAAKAGGTVDEWLAAMSADTWYSAEEAVAAKLADRVLTKDGDGTAAKNRWTPAVRAQFGHPPDPKPPAPPGTSPRGGTPVDITDEQLTRLRQQAGVADDADLDTTLDALDEALEERADPPAGDQAVADQLAALRADNQRMSGELADLRAGRATDAKAAFFAEMESTGRLKPADKKAWSDRWDKAGGPDLVRDIVGGRTPGSEVPLAELGHAGGTAGTDPTDDDRLYGQLFGETPKVGG